MSTPRKARKKPSPEFEALWTTAGVCRFFGIDKTTLRKVFIREYGLPVIKVKRCYRFDPSAVREFAQNHVVCKKRQPKAGAG